MIKQQTVNLSPSHPITSLCEAVSFRASPQAYAKRYPLGQQVTQMRNSLNLAIGGK